MKKIIGSTLAILGLAVSGYSQGVITFDASGSSGIVQINGVTAAQDINATLLYFNGSSYAPLVTLLLSDTTPTFGTYNQLGGGSTQAAGGDITAVGGGVLFDNSGNPYQITTIAPGTVVSFEIQGWLGNGVNTYAAATTRGTSAPFNETLSAAASPILAALDQMPTFNLTPVPEPATFAMLGLGLASVLAIRRRK